MTARCLLFIAFMTACSCKSDIKQQTDRIYSRHLQRHVNLTVISGPVPKEKSELNLLFYLNSEDIETYGIKKIIDSLYEKKLINPLVLVGVDGNKEEYGLGSIAGKASKFNEFVMDELYPFAKKKSGVRKFHEVAIWGASQQGLSAFDIAWNNDEKIRKVGIFRGAFEYAGHNDSSLTTINHIRQSRKRPVLDYWICAPAEDTATNQFAAVLHKKNTSGKSGILSIEDTIPGYDAALPHQFATFVVWAFGR